MLFSWHNLSILKEFAYKTVGFAFDSEPVATQIAQCSAVAEEYLPALNCGAVDVDSTLEAFNAALKDAGVEQIIAEMQSQIDAWLATK